MGYAAHNLTDFIALARILRECARQHEQGGSHDLLVSAAPAVEARAHFLAQVTGAPGALDRGATLHAPVNLVV